MNDNPEFDIAAATAQVEEAFETARTARDLEEGVFQHTFLEMWELALQNHINSTVEPLTIPIASSVLDAYSWLTHKDLSSYRADRLQRLQGAKACLEGIFQTPKQKKKVHGEASNDWIKHKDLYIQLIAEWQKLTSTWEEEWNEGAAAGEPDPITHATIGDISAILLNTQYGFVESLKNLKGFSFSDEDREKLDELIGADSE